jgi:LysR family transcriptional regulator, nitrogen assimilation regulatory protein
MKHNDHQLRLFLAVAQAGSLRLAAEQLQLTQPALSKQMKILERVAGAALFRRDGRGMTLTPLGEQLHSAMQEGYAGVDAAFSAITGVVHTQAGQISVATVNTLAIYLLPRVVQLLKSAHPLLQVSIFSASAPDVVEKVARGQADVGIVYDQAVNTDEVLVHRLHMEELAGYRARHTSSKRRTLADLNQQQMQQSDLILPPRPYALRRVIERELDEQLRVTCESNDILVSLDLASRGLGLAVLPADLPDALIAAYPVERVKLLSGSIKRSVVAITRRKSRRAGLGGDPVSLMLAAIQNSLAHD